MGTFNNNSTWGKILNILITILTAIATTFGAQSCMWILRLSESRAKLVWAMPSVSKIDEVNNDERRAILQSTDERRGLFYQLISHDKTWFIFANSTFLHSMATRSFARWPTDGNMMWMDGYYGIMFHLVWICWWINKHQMKDIISHKIHRNCFFSRKDAK